MTLFYIIHGAGEDYAVTYQGMSTEDVAVMLTDRGLTFEAVTEKAYNTFIQGLPAPAPPPDTTADRAILKNPQATNDQKINALIKILGL